MEDGSVSHAAPANGRSSNADRDNNQSHAVQAELNHARVEDDEEEDDDDFAVRREGEDDDEDEWSEDSEEDEDDNDDDDDDDDEDEEELRARYRRFIDDEAAEDSDDDSLGESSILDSTPPSTPSEIGFFSRQPIFRGEKPPPVKKTSSLLEGGPTTFPQFSRLPAELRLRIWEMHCPCSRQQRRVIRLINENRPLLVPWSLLARQTRALRWFMRISRETRAIGLRVVPDELPVEYGIVRFNAANDVVHVDYEDGHLLFDPAQRYTSPTREAALLARLPKFPYAHVRNIAIIDCEIRSREPGAYLDYEYGRSIIEFWAADMVSHQRPQELRSPAMVQNLLQRFPKLDNVYVVERANKRRINAWVGDMRPGNHQQFRIHTKEGDGEWQSDVDYVYCWHEPPPAWLRQRQAERAARRARKKTEAITNGLIDRGGDSEGDIGCGSDDESKPAGSDGKIEGDFDNDIVVNYMSLFRARGVRFSRMLLFELDLGLDIYYELRRECGPEGVWPLDSKGQPAQDDPPLLEDDGFVDVHEERTDDEYESSGIDDDELEESDTGESGSDEIIDDGEHGPDDAVHGFSSPEGTPSEGEESGGEGSSHRRRAKRRRVVTDSDDESAGAAGEGAGGRVAESDSDGPPPAKRMTLAQRLSRGREEHPLPPESGEEDEEDEDAGDYGPQDEEDEDEDEDEEADEM